MDLRGGRLSACTTAKPDLDIEARAKKTPAADGGLYNRGSSSSSLHTRTK
jgi:hypothetical protein